MIHISNNLYLSSPSLIGNPIIGYKSILTTSNISSDYSPVDTPVINLINEQTNQYWQSDSTEEQYIYIDNSESQDVDYIGITRHNFGSGAITYSFEGTSDQGSPQVWDILVSEHQPSDDKSIIHHFDSTNYSEYRLKLTPYQGSPSTEPMIAHMKLGQVLALPQSIYVGHSPITLSRKTDVVTNTSENGQFLGRIQKRQYLVTAVEMGHISPAYYRTYIDPFVEHAITGAFFFAWYPTSYPTEVGFGWADGDINPSNQLANGMMQFSFSMKAVV